HLRRRVWFLPALGRPAPALGPGTADRAGPVSGSGPRGGVRYPASRPRSRDASRASPSRQPGTGRRGRGPGAVATAAGEALVGVGEGRVKMTLTSPGCPAGPMITNDAYRVLRGLEGVKDVDIEIVWEPYWTPERMDPKVRALMGL